MKSEKLIFLFVIIIFFIVGFFFFDFISESTENKENVLIENISFESLPQKVESYDFKIKIQSDKHNLKEGILFVGKEEICKLKNQSCSLNLEELENISEEDELICLEGKIEVGLLGLGDWIVNPCWKFNKTNLIKEYNKGYNVFPYLFSVDFRRPYGMEMMNFVRPQDVVKVTQHRNANLIETYDDVIEKMNFNVAYVSDKISKGEEEYWKLPTETLMERKGDCEDYTVLLVSLLRHLNYSCYNIQYETHLGAFCYYSDTYEFEFIDDLTSVKRKFSSTSSDYDKHKDKLKDGRYMYFSYYGLDTSERKIYAAFNEKEYFDFETDDEFLKWVIYNVTNLEIQNL